MLTPKKRQALQRDHPLLWHWISKNETLLPLEHIEYVHHFTHCITVCFGFEQHKLFLHAINPDNDGNGELIAELFYRHNQRVDDLHRGDYNDTTWLDIEQLLACLQLNHIEKRGKLEETLWTRYLERMNSTDMHIALDQTSTQALNIEHLWTMLGSSNTAADSDNALNTLITRLKLTDPEAFQQLSQKIAHDIRARQLPESSSTTVLH